MDDTDLTTGKPDSDMVKGAFPDLFFALCQWLRLFCFALGFLLFFVGCIHLVNTFGNERPICAGATAKLSTAAWAQSDVEYKCSNRYHV
jgi:hypothetical protein